MTNFIQPIDEGLDRSVRVKIGNNLNHWLMEASNMERWEGNMSASKSRVLRDIMSEEYDIMS